MKRLALAKLPLPIGTNEEGVETWIYKPESIPDFRPIGLVLPLQLLREAPNLRLLRQLPSLLWRPRQSQRLDTLVRRTGLMLLLWIFFFLAVLGLRMILYTWIFRTALLSLIQGRNFRKVLKFCTLAWKFAGMDLVL